MPSFSYQAISETGTTVKGAIEADSEAMAESLLSSKGYVPLKISAARVGAAKASLWTWIKEKTGALKPQDLILFTKQFRSMLHAGVPILRLMQVLEAQTENKVLKMVIAQMAQDIRGGATLFEATEKHPAVFSSLYRSMVRAGELSGSLPDVLSRLVYIIEHETKIRSDIKAALQYPKIVVLALGIAFFVLLTFVIPKFVAIFAKAGLTLPLPTKIAMLMYQFLSNYWHVIIAVIASLIFVLRAYFKTNAGRLVKDAFFLRLPIFGPLFNKAALSRFASIFAILHSSGVPVLTSMSILAGTIGNSAIAREFERVREKMGEGQGIAAPLRSAKYFTPMVVDMVAIGEETGNIEDMLREITIHYDDEVAYAVKGLSDAIGPILIVGLAAVVGFFALAIFLPMWDLTKMVK